jgi:hypothetical protein
LLIAITIVQIEYLLLFLIRIQYPTGYYTKDS